MKINWGTGIVLAFIGFISFIMYFVVNMNTNKKYDHDLVTEDYYKQELEFQKLSFKALQSLFCSIQICSIQEYWFVTFLIEVHFLNIFWPIFFIILLEYVQSKYI